MERRSESVGKLMKALAAAQAEIPLIPRDSENPFHKSRYAGLGNTLKVVGPILAKHGIAVLQPISCEGGKVIVTTMLAFEDEWIAGDLAIQAINQTPQSIASASTYARRYGYQGMTGVAAEDDDAESAEGRSKGATKESIKAAQKEVLDRKLAEMNDRGMKKAAPPPIPEPPLTTDEYLNVGPHDISLEDRLKASIDQVEKRKKHDSKYREMLDNFAYLRAESVKIGKLREVYYATLGANGLEHSNEIKDLETGRRIYREMAARLSEAKGLVDEADEAEAMKTQ